MKTLQVTTPEGLPLCLNQRHITAICPGGTGTRSYIDVSGDGRYDVLEAYADILQLISKEKSRGRIVA